LGYQEPDTGHGKLSVQLDLRTPAGIEKLRGLVRDADVFSQGYRPGALAARGFAAELLHKLRPGVVCLSLSAFSHIGPWAPRRGFDTVVQAVSGMAIRQAEALPTSAPGPRFYPVSAIDYCTGYLMATGAMIALKRRATEGGSWLVRISLAQVGKWITDLGELPASALREIPAEFTPEEIEAWSVVTETPQGKLRHLRPVAQMSETPPRWARPSVSLGYNRPEWLPRSADNRIASGRG
jgi:crotonobetainyl-CoA:carnitine CoA-transferase CaiB-like acyl-CoA transferase